MIKYLALGDSYTIGEAVPYEGNFPSQVTALLNAQNQPCVLDKLIAVTGWTTDELFSKIEQENPSTNYNLVTLLIGVNNQYRGRSTAEYRWQFYALLQTAIRFAQGNPKQVVVLSIPDWGLTPFNTTRDAQQTSIEIDQYNAINKEISEKLHCHYIDITPSTRAHAKEASYLVADQLHYSEKEYALWAEKIVDLLKAN